MTDYRKLPILTKWFYFLRFPHQQPMGEELLFHSHGICNSRESILILFWHPITGRHTPHSYLSNQNTDTCQIMDKSGAARLFLDFVRISAIFHSFEIPQIKYCWRAVFLSTRIALRIQISFLPSEPFLSASKRCSFHIWKFGNLQASSFFFHQLFALIFSGFQSICTIF